MSALKPEEIKEKAKEKANLMAKRMKDDVKVAMNRVKTYAKEKATKPSQGFSLTVLHVNSLGQERSPVCALFWCAYVASINAPVLAWLRQTGKNSITQNCRFRNVWRPFSANCDGIYAVATRWFSFVRLKSPPHRRWSPLRAIKSPVWCAKFCKRKIRSRKTRKARTSGITRSSKSSKRERTTRSSAMAKMRPSKINQKRPRSRFVRIRSPFRATD